MERRATKGKWAFFAIRLEPPVRCAFWPPDRPVCRGSPRVGSGAAQFVGLIDPRQNLCQEWPVRIGTATHGADSDERDTMELSPSVSRRMGQIYGRGRRARVARLSAASPSVVFRMCSC